MKAKRADVERALARGVGEVRLFLFHGPDTAGSNDLAARTIAGLKAERVALRPAALKDDPSLLAAEAAAFSLFGGNRAILVEGAGDDIVESVERLLDGTVHVNSVILIGSALRKGSKLLGLAESSPLALACTSYVPEGRDAYRLVSAIGTGLGLAIPNDVARRVAEAVGGDRAVIARELEKFALYLDAAPDRNVALGHDVVDALLAGGDEQNVSRISEAVLEGDLATLDEELGRAGPGHEVTTAWALSQRVITLTRLRFEVDGGNSVSAVIAAMGKSLFYKDRPSLERQLHCWTSARLASALRRLLTAERAHKSTGGLGAEAVGAALYALCGTASGTRQ